MCDHGVGGCHHEASEMPELLEGHRYDMHQYIDMDKVTVLNESIDGQGKLVFKPMDRRLDRTNFVISDCDEELLFNVPFTGQVRISGLSVIGDDDGSHPAKIRVFKDRPADVHSVFCKLGPEYPFAAAAVKPFGREEMSFDDCLIEPDQEIDLKQDPNGVVDYPLKAAKFGTVSHLSIHVAKNFGDELTKVNYIGLRGEYQADFRQQIAITTYEARPMAKDHKGEIPDAVSRTLF